MADKLSKPAVGKVIDRGGCAGKLITTVGTTVGLQIITGTIMFCFVAGRSAS